MAFIGPRSALKLLETFTTYIFEHIYVGGWQLIICQPFVDIHTNVLSLRTHKGRNMVFFTKQGQGDVGQWDILTIHFNQQKVFLDEKTKSRRVLNSVENELIVLCIKPEKDKNDRRNSGGTPRQEINLIDI